MYFQVCSNSAYPQHSGERYRTNGPLVIIIIVIIIIYTRACNYMILTPLFKVTYKLYN